jgi:hypothetical protein
MPTRKQVAVVVLIITTLFLTQSITTSGAEGTWTYIPVVSRYLGYRESSGMLDPSFGTGGIVRTSLEGYYNVVLSLALQPDGKIVLAGYSGDFVLLRYK